MTFELIADRRPTEIHRVREEPFPHHQIDLTLVDTKLIVIFSISSGLGRSAGALENAKSATQQRPRSGTYRMRKKNRHPLVLNCREQWSMPSLVLSLMKRRN